MHHYGWGSRTESTTNLRERKRERSRLGSNEELRASYKNTLPVLEMAPGTVAKYYRTLPPAHYSLKIESFDVLSKLKKYDSPEFTAGGYKWRLSLYPKGNEGDDGSGYISLYLSIVQPPPDRKVHANYRLFVYDNSRNKYLTIQGADGEESGFCRSRARLGFPRFLSLRTFKNPSNGYCIERGACTFGAEVFVIQPARIERKAFTLLKYGDESLFLGQFDRWSTTDENCRSVHHSYAGRNWKLLVYPKGDAAGKGQSLSIYLQAQGLTGNKIVYADFSLRVLDQRRDTQKKQDVEKRFNCWLSASHSRAGAEHFMPLKYLKPKAGKEFVKDDTLVVQVQFIAFAKAFGVI